MLLKTANCASWRNNGRILSLSDCIACWNASGTLGTPQESSRWDLRAIHSISRQRFLRFCDKPLHDSTQRESMEPEWG